MHINAHHLIVHYGYIGVFVILLAEMIGIPFPAETTLALAGIAWTRGTLSLIPLMFASAIGNITGSLIAYGVGRFLRPLVVRFGKYIGLTSDRLEKVETKFQANQISIVLFSKFIAGFRVLVPYVAGIHRMPFVPFLIYTTIGAFAWTTTFIFLGKYIGAAWRHFHRFFLKFLLPIIALAAASSIGFLFYRRRFTRKERQNVGH